MTNVSFKLINGNDLEEYEEEFKKLYNDSTLPVRLIPEKLGITTGEYRRLRKTLLEKGEIKLRRKPNKKPYSYHRTPKNYSYNRAGHGTYTIIKNHVYYGTVKKEDDAVEVVRRLRECNWDKSKFKEIKKQVLMRS